MQSDLEGAVNCHLNEIGKIGFNGPTQGWTRLAFSPDEDRVHEYAAGVMRQCGLETHTDAFGNLYGRNAAGPNDRRVMLGTHLDTVRRGGNYDGVVGFIVAIEGFRLAEANGGLGCPVEVAVFRAEESTRFNRSCLGSRAAFGRLTAMDLQTLRDKALGGEVSLEEVLRQRELDPAKIGRPLISPSRYGAYFETHIEQARVLDGRDLLGVVTSIRAPERRQFTVSHKSGRNCPEVLKAAARMIAAIEWTAELFDGLGDDIVATVGKIEDYFQNAVSVNTISGDVRFALRAWDSGDERLAHAVAKARGLEEPTVTAGPHGGFEVTVTGTADHSGGTPMGRLNRRDAVAAACEIVQSLPVDRLPAIGQIRFFLDLRSRSKATRRRVRERIIDTLAVIATGLGVELEVDDPTEQGDPVKALDHGLQEQLRGAAKDCEIVTEDLPSGAGHDAMIAAQAGIRTAMLFVPSKFGLSHNPNEYTDCKFICDAVRIQANVLRRLRPSG